jgi:hypothetical protein
MQQPLEAMHTSHPIQLQVDKDLAILIRCMALEHYTTLVVCQLLGLWMGCGDALTCL